MPARQPTSDTAAAPVNTHREKVVGQTRNSDLGIKAIFPFLDITKRGLDVTTGFRNVQEMCSYLLAPRRRREH